MKSDLADSLRAAGFHGDLRAEEPLAPFTTWRIGGPAELLATPASADDLAVALRWADRQSVAWRVLGNGSNLLVRDAGVRGLVLRLRRTLDETRFDDGGRVTAGAGRMFPALANEVARRGLGGLEFAAGIPGTVGGAVVMNAGWHEFETGNHVERVDWLDERGDRHEVAAADCEFAYRDSAFRTRRGIVLGVTFALAPGEAEVIRERLERFAESRKANQPTELPSCGSVFIQPPGDYAGRLIDEAGLKGLRVGDIEVSPKHANFFVNLGEGTAAQVLELVERVETTIADRTGIRLTREFELW